MNHDFEALGPERFQHLAQALLVSLNPRTTCFPIGQPDGGRDAISPFNVDSNREELLVYQVKFARNPAALKDISAWLLEKFESEAEKIDRLKSKGAREYFLVTNVQGSSHLDSGSIDRTFTALRRRLGIPVHCWFRDDLNRLLESQWDIKLRYPEILSGHDFFRLLVEHGFREQHERRLNALRAFLGDQYEEDVQVKFKQIELQNKLLDLFIDLPFQATSRTHGKDSIVNDPLWVEGVRVLHEDGSGIIINDHQDDSRGTASALLSERGQHLLRQVVVEGAPGQGKSTLIQYMCQVHRIRLLNKQTDLAQLIQRDVQSPLRIPFKVDLRDLAAWLEGIDPFATNKLGSVSMESRTLETFLARLVLVHSGGIHFDVNDLLEISKIVPMFIGLDGLDEVVEIKQRGDVVAAISKALPRLRENCPLLTVVITSRPAAFTNSPGFDVSSFPHIQLLSVKRSQISEYADRWMKARSLNPKEKEEFKSILNEKMSAPHLRDLSRNPMQLAILLSLIHSQGSALPDKRTSLYDEYVDLFFNRESAKSSVVRKHHVLLKDIHRFLGWTLHANAETNKKSSSGRISIEELKSLLTGYLSEEGHPTDVVDEIFGAMLERVVMIVPRIQGTYEFEVQPLREYFAARFLYDTASYSPAGKHKTGTKPDRFDAIARNFYWLNVVRFFAGCFSKGELLDLADRVRALVEDPVLGTTRHSVGLTAALLSDWVFEQSPRAVSQVVDLISTPTNMLKLVPQRHYSHVEIITLPENSGGRRIFDQSFALLESPLTPSDRLQHFASIAAAQLTPDDSAERWLISPIAKTNLARWLAVGMHLGVLSKVSHDALYQRIGRSALSRSMAKTLVEAGRTDCVLNSDNNVQLLQNVLLNSRNHIVPSLPSTAPFYALNVLLCNPPFGLQYLKSGLSPYFTHILEQSLSDEEHDLHSRFDFIASAYRISIDLARAYIDAATAIQQMNAIEDALEQCRHLWGLRPSIAVGLMACAVGRRIKISSSNFDFFSEKHTTSQRLRALKARRTNSKWLIEALDQSQTQSTSLRLLLVAATFCFCSPDTVTECESALSAILDNMDAADWDALAGMVISVDPMRSSREDASSNKFALDSRRFAFLLATVDQNYARTVFMRSFRKYSGKDTLLLQFKLSNAARCALARDIGWDEALEIIRACYSQNIMPGFMKVYLRGTRMPELAFRKILENPLQYPIDLCDAAEASANWSARRVVRPVLATARADRWFID